LGRGLSYRRPGHNRELFAPDAIKIVVDIDDLEASKLPCALPIVAGLQGVLRPGCGAASG